MKKRNNLKNNEQMKSVHDLKMKKRMIVKLFANFKF